MNLYSSYLISLLLLLVQALSAQIDPKIDSLENKLLSSPEEEKFQALIRLSQVVQANNPLRGEEYLSQAYTLIDTTVASEQVFTYFSALSRNKLYQHQYEESQGFIEQAELLGVSAYPLIAMDLFTTKGTADYFHAQFEQAVSAHLQALQICEEQKWKDKKAEVYNNIAVVYMGMQDYKKAEDYTQNALAIADTFKIVDEASRARGNMAIIFAEQGEFDLAEKWFKEDLAFDQDLGDLYSVNKNYTNLGVLYGMQNKFKASLSSYQKGLDIALEIEDKASIAMGYQNIGEAFNKLNRRQEALKNFQKGLEMARNLGNREILKDGYFKISELYEGLGEFETALAYHQKYMLLNDSIMGENHKRNVSELEIKYETEKKQKEILTLSEQKLVAEAKVKEQADRFQKFAAVFGFLSFLCLGLFIIYKLRQENTKQAALLQAIHETQIAERSRIARDLHDSIGASLALNKSKLEHIQDIHPDQSPALKEAVENLKDMGEQVRHISHNLMPSELLKFGLVSALQSHLDQIKGGALETELLSHGLEHRLDKSTEVHIYRIAQELIQNVVKHAKATYLSISIHKYPKYMSLMLEDDGIGINLENAQSGGLGLSNIQQRVDLLKGKLRIDTQAGRGTVFNIEIPL
ncbi:MAG: sensor histidine kinase [Bacteroidota bacterium]